MISSTGTITSANTITGGNIATGGTVSATGNITGNYYFGNGSQLTGVVASSANAETLTGTFLAPNVLASSLTSVGDLTNLSVVGNTTSGNISTAGLISATGNITGGNISTSGSGGSISGTGNITGGNILTGGLVSATGNGTFGNISTAGTFSAASLSASGNITGGNLLTGGLISATGTITSANTITGGNLATGGTISGTGNVTGGNVLTGGLVSATANVTGGNILTGGQVSATGNVTSTANVSGGNILTGGLISATGNVNGGNLVSGANLTITGGNIFSTASAITVNGDSSDVNFAVNGDTTTVFFVDAGTETASFGNSTQTTNAIVAFNATNSILFPVGNTAQRPGTGVTGMVRFNTTNNNMELYDNSAWTAVGVPSFTVIADEQFNGDGSTVAFTLGSTQTTNSCIVSINGVVQIPTSAYSVSGTDPTCVLTFTEAPANGDLIDVREITTTTTVTSISNSSGNAVVAASATAAQVNVTGDLSVSGTILGGNINSTAITSGTSNMAIVSSGGNIRGNVAGATVMTISTGLVELTANLTPTANVTYNLGTTTNRWKDIWLSNSTIYMGNAQISANATSLIFTNPQGGQTVLAGATASITGATVSATGNITGGNILSSGVISTSGNITGVIISAGNVDVTDGQITCGNIINGSGNGVGNIGSSTTYFNTVFAKATSAQYADLAEKYTADAEYVPGTVLVFGGTHEVTVNAVDADRRVAGVVSTNPSYVMNAGLEGANIVTVALTGRVPTLVVGPVSKGDLMVSAGLGRARAEADPRVGTVIGKALEDFDGAEGTIEVVVGRF